LAQNVDYSRVVLTADDLKRIDDLDNGDRIVNPDFAPNWD
tara:strand:+ start:60 stop:179 length:120 start_codon:yes stop_codon:yes gene_type:complete